MSKNKHKISDHERIRIEQAQHKKEFVAKLQCYCDDWGGKGTFALIPPKHVEGLYLARYYSLKFEAHKDAPMTVNGIRKTKKFFTHIIKTHKFSILPNIKEISFDDFMTVGFTLQNFVRWCNTNEEQNDWSPKVAQRLAAVFQPNVIADAMVQLQLFLFDITVYLSAIDKWVVCISYKPRQGENNLKGFENVFEIYPRKAIIKHFTIDDQKRPAYQVMWCAIDGRSPFAQIKPSLFNITTEHDDPIDVYIQSHALNRLQERIDCFNTQSLQVGICNSIKINPKVIITNNQNALLEYKILNQKLGYFVCEYVDGIIFLRTFLFITNNGTPEGKKLFELSGLGKLDKKYLVLDKLSSYIKSDIGTNDVLKTLFTDAGCECLLHLEEELERVASKQSRQSFATHITQYLKKDSNPLDFFDEEED